MQTRIFGKIGVHTYQKEETKDNAVLECRIHYVGTVNHNIICSMRFSNSASEFVTPRRNGHQNNYRLFGVIGYVENQLIHIVAVFYNYKAISYT